MLRDAAWRGADERAAATAVSYHIVYASVQCGKPRRVETQTEREGERDSRQAEENEEEEEEGTARRRKRKRERLGGVAFNQSPASKCTVHVYVYTAG